MFSATALLISGCGDDDLTPGAGPQSVPADAEVVRTYVDALTDRDVDAAMNVRCNEYRIDGDLPAFTTQLNRLLDAVGPVSVVSVDAVPSSGLAPGGEGQNPQEVHITLASRDVPEPEPLVAVLITQDGARRLCAGATIHAAALTRGEHPPLEDLGPPDGTLEALMPTIDRDDYRIVIDEAVSPDPAVDSEWTTGWERIWRTGEYGGVSVWAGRYTSPSAAKDSIRVQLGEFFPAAVATFGVPGIDGAVGVRYLGYGWLGIQPPSQGPFIDRLYILMNDVVIDVAVSNLPSGSTHDLVQTLAAQVLERAGVTPSGSTQPS